MQAGSGFRGRMEGLLRIFFRESADFDVRGAVFTVFMVLIIFDLYT